MKRTSSNSRHSHSRRVQASLARKRSRQRRSRLETLESRHLLAAISGDVFHDANRDGIRQETEAGAADVRVYVDENVNGRLDEGEDSVRTDSSGLFSFSQLPGGQYDIRVAPNRGQVQTSPPITFGLRETVMTEEGVTRRASQVFQIAADGDGVRTIETLGQPTLSRLDGITRLPDGSLLAVDTRANEVFRVNATNGEMDRVGTTNFDIVGGVAYDAVTDTVYTLVRGGIDTSTRRLASLDVDTARVTLIGGGRSGIAAVADIAFDSVNRRLVGFDDTDNEFFAFDLSGNGRTLSTSSRTLDSFSMAIASPELTADRDPSATYVTMFDADDTELRSTVLVNVDTGDVVESFVADVSTRAVALDRSQSGDNPQRLDIGEFQTIAGIQFGVADDVIGFRARPSNPETGVGALGQEGLTVVGGAIGPDVIEVTLNRRPDTNVVFNLTTVTSNGAATGITLDSPTLVFTPDDWEQPRRVTVSPDEVNPVNVITNAFVRISIDQDQTDAAWIDLPNKELPVRVLPPIQSVDLTRPVINEILIEGGFTSDVNVNEDQFIELRGVPNQRMGTGTYLVFISENREDAGSVETIIDLSGLTFGSNGFLVLVQSGNTYESAFGSRVIESEREGFLGLPGDIYSNVDDRGTLFGTFDNLGIFLIQTDTAPVLGDDIDTNNDQRADDGGLLSQWTVFDAVSVQQDVFGDDFGYASILFVDDRVVDSRDIVAPPGATVVYADGFGYVARVGDSIGSSANDWVFGTVSDVSTDVSRIESETGSLFELLGDSISQPELTGRQLNHVGESNFVGGVRGQILLAPSNGAIADGTPADLRLPGQGITVFADTNDNGRRDDLTFVVDPNDVVPPFDPLNPEEQDLDYVVTNEFPGVTITATSGTFFSNQPVLSERQFLGGRLVGNRVFSDGGFQTFSTTNRLRFDFYRPVKSVSIDALGNAFSSAVSYGRLDAFNESGELIASVLSGILVNGRRETISLSVPGEEIVRVEAYSDLSVFGGSTFANFDRLTFTQSEAAAVTDQDGIYEIGGLFPDDYAATVLTGSGATALLGAEPHAFTVSRFENYVFEDVFRVNTLPRTTDQVIVLDENPPVGSTVDYVNAVDADQNSVMGETLTFEVIGGQSDGLLVNAMTGEITVAADADLNFEADPERIFTVRVTDSLAASTTSRITISLRDINEAPVVRDEPLIVTENVRAGSAIGIIRASDPDVAFAQTLTYTVIGGEAMADFSVDPSTGVVTLLSTANLDFERNETRTLVVQVSDDADVPASTIFEQQILVLNENDRPTVANNAFTIPESATGELFRLQVVDPDEGQLHRFVIVGGSAANLVRVTEEGAVRLLPGAELDFESNPNLSLIVNVSDNGSPPLGQDEAISITVTDVNETPRLQPASVQFDENGPPAVTATIALADPEQRPQDYEMALVDGPSNHLFEFVAGTGDDAGTGVLRVAAGQALDFETERFHRLNFLVTDTVDSSVAPTTVTLLVEVVDQNEAPTIESSRFIVSERPRGGEIVGRIAVSDPDGDLVTTHLIGGTAFAQFELDPNSRLLRVKPGAVFEADGVDPPALTLIVRAEDSDTSTDTTIFIDLNNVNEAPEFDVSLAASVFQDQTLVSGQFISFVLPEDLASDPDGGDFSIRIFGEGGVLPSWMTYDLATRTVTASPGPLDTGVYGLTARALEFGPRPLATDYAFTYTVEPGTTPLQNGRNRFDVDSNRTVAPLDALRIINFLQSNGEGPVDFDNLVVSPGFLDVSGNGEVTSLDALLVINEINRLAGVVPQSEPIDSADVDDVLNDDERRRERAIDAALTAEIDGTNLF